MITLKNINGQIVPMVELPKQTKNYFIGVYNDSSIHPDFGHTIKTCQVSDNVDGLSCEILAEPGVIEFTGTAKNGMTAARLVAKKYGCKFLEWNCSKKYELIQLTN